MTRSTLRLTATAAMTAGAMLVAPVAAFADDPSSSMMAKCRGHATMADALHAHPELAEMSMSDMDMSDMDIDGDGSMMAKMRGHATMADALHAHPELADKPCPMSEHEEDEEDG